MHYFLYDTLLDFLGREPDTGGLGYWSGQITQCGSDSSCLNIGVWMSQMLLLRVEYQQTGAYVYRLYRIAYGNGQPTPNPDNSNPTEARKLPVMLHLFPIVLA